MLRFIYNRLKSYYQQKEFEEDRRRRQELADLLHSHFTLDRILYAKGTEFSPVLETLNLIKQESQGLKFNNLTIFEGEAVQLRNDLRAFQSALVANKREEDKELIDVAEGWIGTINGWIAKNEDKPLPRQKNCKWGEPPKVTGRAKRIRRVVSPFDLPR